MSNIRNCSRCGKMFNYIVGDVICENCKKEIEEKFQQVKKYIEETGSMQEACTKMELSYSKASKMMKKAEKQLGFKLLERRIGGSGGGGSRLTEEGRDLLKKYRELTRRVQEDADKVFAEVFGTEL